MILAYLPLPLFSITEKCQSNSVVEKMKFEALPVGDNSQNYVLTAEGFWFPFGN